MSEKVDFLFSSVCCRDATVVLHLSKWSVGLFDKEPALKSTKVEHFLEREEKLSCSHGVDSSSSSSTLQVGSLDPRDNRGVSVELVFHKNMFLG